MIFMRQRGYVRVAKDGRLSEVIGLRLEFVVRDGIKIYVDKRLASIGMVEHMSDFVKECKPEVIVTQVAGA